MTSNSNAQSYLRHTAREII